MPNELLDKGIKAAKSKDMAFAIVFQGKNGSLGIANDEPTAKKQCTEGNKEPKVPGSPKTGTCKWNSVASEYLFETPEASPTMGTALKAILERDLGRKVAFSCLPPAPVQNNGPLPNTPQQQPLTQPRGDDSNGNGNAPPQIDPRMQRKLDEEQKKFEGRLGYSTEEQLNQKLAQIKNAKVPFENKKKAYDKLMSDIVTESNKAKAETKLDDDAKDKIQSRLRNALQRVSAARNEEENAQSIGKDQQKAQQIADDYDTGKQAREKFQTDAIDRREKKAEGNKAVSNRAQQIANPQENLAEQFDVTKLQELAKDSDYNKSELKGVLDAAAAFQQVDEKLRTEGKGTYADFNQALNNVRQAAENYKNTHQKPGSSVGKERLKVSEEVLKRATEVQRVVSAKHDEIRKLADTVLALAKQDKATGAMAMSLEDLKKYPYAGTDIKAYIDKIIKEVRTLMGQKADQMFNNLENPSDSQRAEILLQYGGCKPPSEKGQSDSFFIKGSDGSNAFIFKPIQGEARQSIDWPEGGGAPREILATKLNDLFQSDLGMDLKMPRTTLLKTKDDSFRQGSKSKSPERTGALQTAVQFKPGDPTDAKGFFEKSNADTALKSIDPDDAEAVGMLDFITLNGDRHSANMLVQNPGGQPGQTKLVPIDAGLMLPTKDTFRRGAKSMCSKDGYNPNNPQFDETDNMLMQLPGAQLKFGQKAQDAIAKLDPEKMVESMKVQYADVSREAPEMAGKVDESSFDLMKRSMMFLKKAAPELTQFQIAQVYSSGFEKIMDCEPDKVDAEINKAIETVKKLTQLSTDKKAVLKVQDAGFTVNSGVDVSDLSMEQTVDILENKLTPDQFKNKDYPELQKKLADIATYIQFDGGPFNLGNQLKEPYSDNNYKKLAGWKTYKLMGGDPYLKQMLAGDDATYNLEVATTVAKKIGKFGVWDEAKIVVKVGGYAEMRRQMGNSFAAIVGKPVRDQVTGFIKATGIEL
jgi:hypothetical protein